MIPGSYASAEAIAHIAVQKYVMGSPLYRQERRVEPRRHHAQQAHHVRLAHLGLGALLTPIYEVLH